MKIVILGGAKVKDKIKLIKNLLKLANEVNNNYFLTINYMNCSKYFYKIFE